MNRLLVNRRVMTIPWPALILLSLVPTITAGDSQDVPRAKSQTAARLVASSNAGGGICALVGQPDVALAVALAKQGPFVVHCLYRQRNVCGQARKVLWSRGVYGTVSADTCQPPRFPYASNLINILVIDTGPTGTTDAGFSPQEVLRVLTPLGTAYFRIRAGNNSSRATNKMLAAAFRPMQIDVATLATDDGTWARVTKPWPSNIDPWTHYLHGADGNPVANDLVVGPPKHYQWVGGPAWLRSHETDSSISTLVTARGRLFFIQDQAPISLAGNNGLPDKWFLVARDAFNGTPLWQVPIKKWGWRQWKDTWFDTRPGDIPLNIQKRLVAVGDKVYVTLGYRAAVSQLDARSGKILQTYAGTERAGEILYRDGTLIVSVIDGDRVKVLAIDAATGARRWATPPVYRGSTVDYLRWTSQYGRIHPPKLDPSINMAANGDLVALIDGPDLVGLDFGTGRPRWRSRFPAAPADRRAGGMRSHGNLWIGTLIVRDGVVIHASPSRLAAFAANTGRLLWYQPKKYIGHLWYEWKDVFVIDGLVWTWSSQLENRDFNTGRKRKQRVCWPKTACGYNLKTGVLAKEVPVGAIFQTHHHHRCYRDKATLRYILASRRGTEFVDLKTGHHSVHNWVRGTCHLGMMPANGLQYVPPHPCQCYMEEKLNGFLALAPAEPTAKPSTPAAASAAPSEPRFEKGPAYDPRQKVAPGPRADVQQWPTFRHDSMRTGAVATDLPTDLARRWRVHLAGTLSPPIVVRGKLFVASVDAHHLVCLDTRDGHTLWQFAAGARIDSPPTYVRGAVVFGSADGWVYSLCADDGQLQWRFRAAPRRRLIGAFGQLESAWPVHGSVLAQSGTAYFAAGRSSQLDGGIFLYGLDAASGSVRYKAHLEGPDYVVNSAGKLVARPGLPPRSGRASNAFDVNFKLPMGALPDILMGDGSRVFMRSLAFDAALHRMPGMPDMQAKGGFLDASYFKRAPWTFHRADYARLIAHDKRSVYFVRMFDTLRGLDPTVFFTPGSKGYLLFAKNVGGQKNTWAERIPIRVRAMLVAGTHLVVAGPPDQVDPHDPLAAFEGRAGGVLYVLNVATGKQISARRLPFPPVFDGIAAATGCLYLVEQDGTVTCFGRRDS